MNLPAAAPEFMDAFKHAFDPSIWAPHQLPVVSSSEKSSRSPPYGCAGTFARRTAAVCAVACIRPRATRRNLQHGGAAAMCLCGRREARARDACSHAYAFSFARDACSHAPSAGIYLMPIVCRLHVRGFCRTRHSYLCAPIATTCPSAHQHARSAAMTSVCLAHARHPTGLAAARMPVCWRDGRGPRLTVGARARALEQVHLYAFHKSADEDECKKHIMLRAEAALGVPIPGLSSRRPSSFVICGQAVVLLAVHLA